jgi:hypothetical protein|nr:hypothetical protein [uncultured Limnohabitans sp.]
MMGYSMKVLLMFKTFLFAFVVWSGVCLAETAVVKKQAAHPVAKARTASASTRATTAAQARLAAEATAALQAQAISDAATNLRTPERKAASLPPVPAVSALAPSVRPGAQTDLNLEELAIAERIHQGVMPCELGASVRLEADAAKPGYFHVLGKGFRYHMQPVRTSSGAIRLEDKKAGAVWLQLANKSMLMDQTKGRRLADECANPEQVAFAETMKTNPPPSLIDTTGMGR